MTVVAGLLFYLLVGMPVTVWSRHRWPDWPTVVLWCLWPVPTIVFLLGLSCLGAAALCDLVDRPFRAIDRWRWARAGKCTNCGTWKPVSQEQPMPNKSREEHLEWAKTRAREYLTRGDAKNAIASMASDLQKHESWQGERGAFIAPLLLMAATEGSIESARRFVEGFN